MAKYCNNPDCEAYKKPQEGKHCSYCGESLYEDASRQHSISKEIKSDGITVSRVMNDSHDTISNNNTTIVLNGKSLEDLTIKERKAAYRKYCTEKIKNGIISSDLRRALDEYALELDLSSEERKEVERMVKKHSAQTAFDLNPLDQENLEIIKAAVSNNKIRISDVLPKLEAMSVSGNDEVLFYHSMLLSCSSPTAIIRKYSDREQDDYWLAFWTYLAFIKNGQKLKAEQTLRELSAWDSQSQDNLFLLQSIGAILGEDYDTATMFINRAKNTAYLLVPIKKAVSFIQKTHWAQKPSNSPEVNFYLEKIFGFNVEEAITYQAPIPDALKRRMSGQVTSSPTNASSVIPVQNTVGNQPSVNKASGNKYLGALAIVAVIVALIVFIPRNKKQETEYKGSLPSMVKNEQSAPSNEQEVASSLSTSKPASSTTSTKSTPSGTAKVKTTQSSSTPTAKQESSPSESHHAVQNQRQIQESSQPKADPIASLKASAEAGDKDAQYSLGMKYYDGDGVAKNYSTAFQYLKTLADAGYTKAYFPVAEMYHGGRGVTKDREAAEKWYQKAADAGNAKAKSILLNSF